MSRTEANAQLVVTEERKINLTKRGCETGKNTVFNNVPLLVFKYEMVRGVGFGPSSHRRSHPLPLFLVFWEINPNL